MYCRHCGADNSDNAQFCRQCGQPIRPSGNIRIEKRPGDGRPFPLRPAAIAIIAGAVIVVVIAVVLIVTIGSCSGGGRSSSDQLAQDVTAMYNKALSSTLSDSDIDVIVDDILSMMPKEGVDVLLKESNLADSSEVSRMLREKMSSGFSGYKSYIEKLGIECSVYPGDKLSMSEIQSINKRLSDAGVDMHVSEANKLLMDIKISALEDIGLLSQGESQTQTSVNTGLIAIEVNGRWYLWGDSLL